jgi:hypothetical protein
VQTCVLWPPDQRAREGRHSPLLLALHRKRIAERDECRRVLGIDVEDAAEQRGAVSRAVGDEGGDGGQMQRRDVIRIAFNTSAQSASACSGRPAEKCSAACNTIRFKAASPTMPPAPSRSDAG